MSYALVLVSVVILAAQITVGFIGNLKVCLLLYKRKDLRKVPHFLLGNLSITGLLVSTIYVPSHLAAIVMKNLSLNSIPRVVCVTRLSSSLLFFVSQALTLVAMAIDRHDSVVRPFKRRITLANITHLLEGIWSAAFLLTALSLCLGIFLHFTCDEYTPLQNSLPLFYTVALCNILLFGTVAAIFVTFLRIVKRLRSSSFAETNQRHETQVTRFSYILMSLFLLSWLPVTLFNIVGSAAGVDGASLDGPGTLLLSLSNFNYVVNPFLHMKIFTVQRRLVGPEHQEEQ